MDDRRGFGWFWNFFVVLFWVGSVFKYLFGVVIKVGRLLLEWVEFIYFLDFSCRSL